MTDIESLKRIIKVCMFDQYGTVVDMQTGLWEIAVDFLKTKDMPVTQIETPGLHTWMVWRDNLIHFTPLLFQK